MDFMEAISVFITSILILGVVNRLMAISPSLQTVVEGVRIRFERGGDDEKRQAGASRRRCGVITGDRGRTERSVRDLRPRGGADLIAAA